MAERPIFVPVLQGARTFMEVPVSFTWHPGMAASQKKKNVLELHAAAAGRGFPRLLEVSTKSERAIGQRLSAFHQRIELSTGLYPLESVYQGSKVFEDGGPFLDLLDASPRDAKRDARLRGSGRLLRFELEGQSFPLDPPTAFYDWLYLRCIYPEREWLRRLETLDGFTDIEFNPARSVNCQARACAIFVALQARGALDEAIGSYPAFVAVQAGAASTSVDQTLGTRGHHLPDGRAAAGLSYNARPPIGWRPWPACSLPFIPSRPPPAPGRVARGRVRCGSRLRLRPQPRHRLNIRNIRACAATQCHAASTLCWRRTATARNEPHQRRTPCASPSPRSCSPARSPPPPRHRPFIR